MQRNEIKSLEKYSWQTHTHKHKQSSHNGLNLHHIWQNIANSWSYKNFKPECSIKFAHLGSSQQPELQVQYLCYHPKQQIAAQNAHNPAAESARQIQMLPFSQAHHLIPPFAGIFITSHLPRRPVSWSRDQMLWILPACSGWLFVFPQVHWCFSIKVSYTRPVAEITKLLSVKNRKKKFAR